MNLTVKYKHCGILGIINFKHKNMNTIKSLVLVLIIAIVSVNYSCKKQEDVSIDKVEEGEVSFSPMSVGNYWVYEVYSVDKQGNATYNSMDSTYISKTTTVNGNSYFEYRTSSSVAFKQLLRDSSNYLVDDKGEKFFHPTTKDTLKNEKVEFGGTVFSHTYRLMHIPNKKISCAAGDFDALESRLTAVYPILNTENISSNYYSAGIGLIRIETAPGINGDYKLYSLKRWHLNLD